jgi:response regulator of citrate/malate metabolism
MAASLAQAREALAGSEVDAILLDLNLPDGSGLDLAREVLQQPGKPPQVIVLSADAMPDSIQAAHRAGVVDYLVKPLDFDALWSVLTRPT